MNDLQEEVEIQHQRPTPQTAPQVKRANPTDAVERASHLPFVVLTFNLAFLEGFVDEVPGQRGVSSILRGGHREYDLVEL